MKLWKRAMISVLGILCFVGLDQWTKALAVRYLPSQSVELWPNVFELHYLENRGMAFGLFQNQQIIFVIITVIILAVVIYFWRKTPFTKHFLPLQILMVTISAGAIGNLIDRLSQGYVVDFLYFKLIDFPIFNVADIYVTLSCILAVIYLFFFYSDEELVKVYGRKKQETPNE